MNPVLFIILISVAGPVIGSLIGVIKKPSNKYMFNMLAFAAGVMLALSFLQLIPESIELSSIWVCAIGFVMGALVMFGIDRLIPHIHPEMFKPEERKGHKLKRTAIYLLIGIFLHNFPEGLAMGIGAISGMKFSIIVAIAIAVHDIPEGICTSAPYYFVSKKRLKSFLLSASTALPTIAGFLLSHYLFPFIPLVFVGLLIAATAGIMIYISSDELIPSSCSKITSHSTIFSLIAGVLLVILLGLL